MSTIAEIFRFIMTRKKYWLLPLFLTFMILGGLMYYSAGTIASPFIYTLF